MSEYAVSAIAGIGVLALLCQWFAWWVKLPAILFLLLAGILVGPVLDWVRPDELFGELLFPFVSLSVAVILFEGALTLRLNELGQGRRVVLNMVSLGAMVSAIITTLLTYALMDVSWQIALLFGTVVVVTGPTVIVPMLRTVRPNARVANILRWEGIVIDPIGALLAVLVYDLLFAGQGSHAVMIFIQMIAVGIAFGIAAGYGLGAVLRAHLLPEYLHNVATLLVVFAAFAASNALLEESGLLTVTVMGFWLANMKQVPTDDILHFKESLTVLLISGLFITLAARMDLSEFTALGLGGLGVFLGIQFLARPATVFASTINSELSFKEKLLLSWIAPRGIVAAAVSALFALKLEMLGVEGADMIVPLVFMIIIGTVVLQSATAGPLARKLGVAEPEPRGFLIIGANPVARAIAQALNEAGFRTHLTDSNWEHVRAARMSGLQVYYGNAVSEHADHHLDLVGIGRMLGLSRQADLNVVASYRYRNEFGRTNVYAIQTREETLKGKKHSVADEHKGHVLFDQQISYQKLAKGLRVGAEIRSTRLSEEFGYEDYLRTYDNRVVPLFALSPKEALHVFTANDAFKPSKGWRVLGLVWPDDEQIDRTHA